MQNENPKTKIKRQHSPDNISENETKDLLAKLPSRLAKRVMDYAIENETTAANVVIEALDTFLRGQQNRSG